MCRTKDCKVVAHIGCWSTQALQESIDEIIPNRCTCPSCGSVIPWRDMMMELSLRVRGQKEIEKLLKKPRRRNTRSPTPNVPERNLLDPSD